MSAEMEINKAEDGNEHTRVRSVGGCKVFGLALANSCKYYQIKSDLCQHDDLWLNFKKIHFSKRV